MLHTETRYNLSCDICEELINDERAYAKSESDILADAKAEGWKIEDGKHICPDCQEQP